ncbi:DUF1028 domain-containing protein [Chelatococcus asaccharovorans]|uniref:Putative Ntn-hydrolase superfamily protein n=1 Tax=Chelatococcus asaccharovorans TaxID=28210 RepID=A0A2V3UD06_9HYPH|nr:DUF1028 domain-containing protein [Chelatococcus asaccharovorans]MBS7706944.1 DUF1028 domain-containing protein [Chelatococcus asaccharovorans]PXW63123.1 putative Ntn-hydrolase superfamily protein [Chelatococcus asaccharovorans]CAH1653846.1 putative Ntn-hydrolase superfamily protein [Chelatococcus asaccharovorans]CAH1694357.1 putative Ntn-hydrolase superfamily protein [Chelatococcus asaccharovorans]
MNNPLDLGGVMLSVLACDPRDQTLGIALASSAIAVAARCPYLVVGKAVVASQGFSNLKVGPLALDLIQCGLTVQETMQALRQHDRWMDYRQIAIVAASGEVEVHTGPMNVNWAGHVSGSGFVCLGNGLPDQDVLAAMQRRFIDAHGQPMAERLLATLEAARGHLGPESPLLSSSLLVRTPGETVHIDLRVDLARDPPEAGGCALTDLRRLFERYLPLTDIYKKRSMSPHPT